MYKKLIVVSTFILTGLLVFVSISASVADRNKNDLFKQITLFSDVLSIVQSEYVDETKPKDLIYGSLKGMLASLDLHSQFMDPETYNELKVETKGQFGGLGIEVTVKDGLLTIITPIEDTPAWKAGLKPLDKIVKINNEITRDMALSDAVKLMRGRPGEAVNLTILREPNNKILEFNIIRDIIKIKDIKEVKFLEGHIGYIRLSEFRVNSGKNIGTSISDLSKKGMSALILDLRNNPGGLLESAVDVAGRFLDKGKLVVYTEGRKAEQNMKFFASYDKPILSLPLVILINEGSASGSEIVAGALKDYKRATIIGMKSFGKGSVQTVIPLSDGSALKLTTSKYFTPGGSEIQGKGVTPDIVVENLKKTEDSGRGITPEDYFIKTEDKKQDLQANFLKDYREDKQIMRAVELLKTAKPYK